jgi:hypothetical protein
VAARSQGNSAVYVSTGAIMWALDTQGAVSEKEQCLMSAPADAARAFRSAALLAAQSDQQTAPAPLLALRACAPTRLWRRGGRVIGCWKAPAPRPLVTRFCCHSARARARVHARGPCPLLSLLLARTIGTS